MCFGVSLGAFAQHSTEPNKWFNHVELGITAGTSGFGFDLAAPMTDWARFRAGGVFRPLKNYSAKFGMEVAEGLAKNINEERFEKLATMMEGINGYKPSNKVEMQGSLGFNNLKVMVDIYPFKNNRHWYASVGLFWGNNTLITAKNTPESMNTLTAVATYNTMYRNVIAGKDPIDMHVFGLTDDIINTLQSVGKWQEYKDKLKKWGSTNNDANGNPVITEEEIAYQYIDKKGKTVNATATVQRGEFSEYGISIPIGKYAHDMIAEEDIYYDHSERLYKEADVRSDLQGLSVNPDEFHYAKDANGRYIKEGEVKYKKGEVMHKEGETCLLVPDINNIVQVTAVANRFKPYIGIGYETHFNKDHRAKIGIDAGIMIWGGNPSVNVKVPCGKNADGQVVYQTIDMSRELNDMPKSINSYVTSVKHYPVFPEVSARFSYRFW